uniref:Uncharacterized protein n=1 Tax=Romanomermis culicivorax TaxID=13658 RepID=A0A915IE46_ROMCU
MDLTFVAPFLLFVRAFAEKETVESQLNASINCTETESQITLPNNQSKISVAQDQYYKLYFKGRFHPTKITRKGVVRYKFCSPLENRFLKSEQSCYDIFKVLITEFNTIFYVPFSDIVRCENALYTMLRAGANKTYDLPQFGKQFGLSNQTFEALLKPDSKREPRHELYAFLLVTKDPAEKSRYVKELMTFARNVNQNCTNFVCTVDGLVETPSKAGDIATENPVTMATAKNSKPAATPEREISPKQEVPPDQKMKKTKV